MNNHFSLHRWIYSCSIYGYGFVISIVSLFNKKAQQWKTGRVGVFSALSKFKAQCKKPIVWVHCASLGEFEQGRPVIELLRLQHPEWAFLVTFFSPSGYEIQKNYSGADFVSYLPLDTQKNAHKFVALIDPKFAIFVKYEYWFNYMIALDQHHIPLFVIAAIFRPHQHFFKNYGSWFAKQLGLVTHFFVQNSTSCNLLKSIDCFQYSLCGDPRFDRVIAIKENTHSFPLVEAFCKAHEENMIWVVGSSWRPDELLFVELLAKKQKVSLIIAPHEINEEHICQIETLFSKSKTARFTNTTLNQVVAADVLIINTMGMLSQLFQYADIAYIGGGFGAGIHNILEAAVYEIPVVFGPKYQKFDEAISLINEGGAFSIKNNVEFISVASKLMTDKAAYNKTTLACRSYVEKNSGATEKIGRFIAEYPV